MGPKATKETESQKQVRLRAEAENVKNMQQNLSARTRMFNKFISPRVSIATGRQLTGVSLNG